MRDSVRWRKEVQTKREKLFPPNPAPKMRPKGHKEPEVVKFHDVFETPGHPLSEEHKRMWK